MKTFLKKFIIIWVIICMLLPTLFLGVACAAEAVQLNTERAGNFAGNFAINFYENWSSVTVDVIGDNNTNKGNTTGKDLLDAGQQIFDNILLGNRHIRYIARQGRDSEQIVNNKSYSEVEGMDCSTFVSAALWLAGYEQFAKTISTFDMEDGINNGTYLSYGFEIYKNVQGTIYQLLSDNTWAEMSDVTAYQLLEPGDFVVVNGYKGGHTNIVKSVISESYSNKYVALDCGNSDHWHDVSSYNSQGGGCQFDIWTNTGNMASYYGATQAYLVKVSPTGKKFGSNSTAIKRGEIKTEYDANINPIDPEAQVSPSDEIYKFNNLSWISFVYRNSLFRDSASLSMQDILTGSGDSITINPASFDDKTTIPGVQELSKVSEMIDTAKLITEGKILPGDILYVNKGNGTGEYVLYVGGTKIIYATENPKASPSGALKYEYLQYYLDRIKNELLEESNEEIEKLTDEEKEKREKNISQKYGVTQIYRIKKDVAEKISETDANLFYNGKGYFSYAKYSGIPKMEDISYEGFEDFSFKWLIDSILGIIEFLISLILYAVKMQVIGWANIVENIIQSVILGVSGHNQPSGFMEAVFGTSATSASGERITVESVFFNQIPILDANFFNFETAGGREITTEVEVSAPLLPGETVQKITVPDENNLVYLLRKNLATWYSIFRNFSIAALLIVLVYLGIKMAITVSAEKKADYKKMLLGWVTSFLIVMFIHLFMYAVIVFNDQLVGVIKNIGQSLSNSAVNTSNEEINMYDAVRAKAYAFNYKEGTAATIIYIYLIYLLIRFIFIYLKRFITIYILALSGTLMGIKHALEKIAGKKTTSLHKWMKEYAFNVLLQSVHALIYVVFIGIALNISQDSLAGFGLCLIVLNFMVNADKIVIKVFGLNKAGTLGDVDKPESFIKLITGAYSKVLIGKKLWDFGKTTLWGKRGLISEMRYATTGKDNYKDAEKELLKRKYERIGKRARALDAALASTRFTDVHIRKLFKNLKYKKRMGYRINDSTNKSILSYISGVKKLNRTRFTRPLKFAGNMIFGFGGMAASAAVAIDNPTAGITAFLKAKKKISGSTKNYKNYNHGKYSRRSVSNEKANADYLIHKKRYENSLEKYVDHQYIYEETRKTLVNRQSSTTDVTAKANFTYQIDILDKNRKVEESKELHDLQEKYEEMLDAKNRYTKAKEDNSFANKAAKAVGTVTGLGTLEKMAKGEEIAFVKERTKSIKETAKLDATDKLASLEEELGILTKELKAKQKQYAIDNNLSEEESDKMLNKKLDEIIKESKEQNINAYMIKRAVTEYMNENDISKVTGDDIDGILDKLQYKLNNSQRYRNIIITDSIKNELRKQIEEKMVKDKKGLGFNAKDTTTNIQLALGESGVLDTHSTNNVTDPEMKVAYDKVLQKIKDINTYNEVAKIKNKASLVDIDKILRNVRKMK